MHAIILTLFPEMFPGPLGVSLAGKALARGLWGLETLDIRDFATDKHKSVDDKTYGGGAGLVMKPDVVGAAIDAAKARLPDARLIYPTPRGQPFTQVLAGELVSRQGKDGGIIILCGRYEGVDQRILNYYQPLEVSMGDYILSGGELAALTMLDACIRLIPGVISKEEAHTHESFHVTPSPPASPPTSLRVEEGQKGDNFAGLLEYPHYTAPPSWRGMEVPAVLTGGNHQAIEAWRLEQAKQVTAERRPELWNRYMAARSYEKNNKG